jgi:predicted RNase H-like HicB family nuclease
MTTYALIHEEDGIFGISFPDFPGCISTARSEDEVLRRGAEALAFHVEGMIEDGDVLPTLRSLSELRADPDFLADAVDAIVAIVQFDPPGRAIRVNISMEERLLESIDRAALAAGQSRSAYLADAARQRLKRTA